MTATIPMSTDKYEIFKKHDHNRELCQANLKRIINSLKFNNRLRYYPITVDSQLRVIDGQHRLEAAKALGVPVFYQIIKDAKPEDIIFLNANQKVWNIEDYINFYARNGNENYLKLEDFMKKYKHTPKESVLLIAGAVGHDWRKNFKDGKFVFPDERAFMKVLQMRDNILKVKGFLYSKITSHATRHILLNINFQLSLTEFLSAKSVDFDTFISKLEQKLDWISPRTCRYDYVRLFKNIYNYKNKNPLEIENE